MDYGFVVPTRGVFGNRDAILSVARRAEELGYAYAAATDHIVVPSDIETRYPYTESGIFPGSASGEYMEPLSLMAFLAAATSKIRFLTSVMVVPHRPAILTAKILATIDILSGGRMTVGVGAGWMREEFEAIDAPPFDRRGKVTNEYLEAFRELWSKDDPSFDGEFVKFKDIIFLPKPVQRPGPPIWVGGESKPAMRRAAKLGDGWYPVGANKAAPLDTAPRYAAKAAELGALAEGYGRDPSEIALAFWALWYPSPEPRTTDDGNRMLFTGSNDDVASDIAALRDVGVTMIMLGYASPTVQEQIEKMELFMSDVAPLVGA
jgi:probable F420-dependent oxidoreductase